MTAIATYHDTDLSPWMEQVLTSWLPWQRWFGGKGRPVRRTELISATELVDQFAAGGARAVLAVVAVHFADGDEVQYYQVPLGIRRQLAAEHEHGVLARLGELVIYDAVVDHEINSLLLRLIGQCAGRGNVTFLPEPGGGLTLSSRRGVPSRRNGGDHSNTTVVFGDRYILKLFRRLSPGLNPDLELHRVLRRADNRHVATLLGAVEGELNGVPTSLGMLQSFAAGAADGWSMATASVRDLMAVRDLPPDQVGGDFAGESRRLGHALAEVHVDLAAELGVSRMDRTHLGELSAAMRSRLEDAVVQAPSLRPYAAKLHAVFAAVAAMPPAEPIQRVHGDLHLGQVLRTPTRWLVTDFEGEPAAPVAERVRPHSPWRDIAGMLRSFDYAAHHQLHDSASCPNAASCPNSTDPELEIRARQWADHNSAAFIEGYAATAGTDPARAADLRRAYELDKAVYEVVYETRNRPCQVRVPLAAIARLTGVVTPR